MVVAIGINGFGRVGRATLRCSLSHYHKDDMNIVAINDPFLDTEYMVYLMKHDSAHGGLPVTTVEMRDKETIVIDGRVIKVFHASEPSSIPWGAAGVSFVVEATGVFTTTERAGTHLAGGAQKVVITSTSADAPCFIYGINEDRYKSETQVLSAASCTTVCAAPVLKLLLETFGIVDISLTTLHSASAVSKGVDGGAKSWRQGRSVLGNIIPAATTASQALTKVMPVLQGKLVCGAYYVPTQNVCCVDLTVRIDGVTTKDSLDGIIDGAARTERYKRIIGVTQDQVVSSDFMGDVRSCVYDVKASQVLNGNLLKIVLWYDNEIGYAHRLLDLVLHASKSTVLGINSPSKSPITTPSK